MNNNEKKLLDTIKNVCTNRKCPEWIKNTFIKTIEEIRNSEIKKMPIYEFENSPLEIGDILKNSDEKDKCLYELVEFGPCILDSQLINVKIIDGDINNPKGFIIHNVTATKMRKIKNV